MSTTHPTPTPKPHIPKVLREGLLPVSRFVKALEYMVSNDPQLEKELYPDGKEATFRYLREADGQPRELLNICRAENLMLRGIIVPGAEEKPRGLGKDRRAEGERGRSRSPVECREKGRGERQVARKRGRREKRERKEVKEEQEGIVKKECGEDCCGETVGVGSFQQGTGPGVSGGPHAWSNDRSVQTHAEKIENF